MKLLYALSFFVLCVSSYAERSLRVGAVLGLSGPAAFWSEYQRKGIELAAHQLKEQGVLIELFVEDSKSESVGGVTATRLLISKHKVDVIIGDVFSFITLAMAPVALQQKVPLISPSIQQRDCDQQNNPYLFNTTSQIHGSGLAYTELLTTLIRNGAKKVALVTLDDPGWGNVYQAIWRKVAADLGLELVADVSIPEFTPDFRAIFTPLLSKRPDVILFAHEPLSGIKVLKQLSFGGAIVSANAVLEVLARRDRTGDIAEGAYTVDPASSAEYNAAFKEKFGFQSLLESHASYEAVRGAAKAWLSKGNTSLFDALMKTKFDGLAGDIDFSTPCAGRKAPWTAYQIRNGELNIVNN